MFATLQKLDKVPDDELTFYPKPWPSEARRPLLVPVSVHPRSRDIYLGSLKVEVVCHGTSGHELGDEGFDVLDPGRCAEHEPVTRLPDPFPQNPDPLRQFRCVPKVEHRDGPKFWKRGMQNRVEDTNPVPI